jgi:hypothetical protein
MAVLQNTGVEIRGRLIVPDHNFIGKDDHALIDGSPSDDLIFAPSIVLCDEGPRSFGWDRGTTMFFKIGSPSDNHGILVKHHP